MQESLFPTSLMDMSIPAFAAVQLLWDPVVRGSLLGVFWGGFQVSIGGRPYLVSYFVMSCDCRLRGQVFLVSCVAGSGVGWIGEFFMTGASKGVWDREDIGFVSKDVRGCVTFIGAMRYKDFAGTTRRLDCSRSKVDQVVGSLRGR